MQYVLAAEPLSDRGYEEPFVHYEFEAPSFLLPAVRGTPDVKSPIPSYRSVVNATHH
jgi:hypothetical protein